ncbi:MAG: NAD(P)/FAD-dependent oxidoreductase [Mariprofundales bacterium]|nr:NAD(P)/FAD-dependent oxidoreductase [Mariprofundales bacterium]
MVIVGGSLAAAAAAKRLVDAGLSTLIIEKRKLPRHKICSGILSPRGHRFLIENFGALPPQALHQPTYCRGVTFHFPCGISMPMDFFGGTTPHLHRKYADHWAVVRSGAEVHDCTSFVGLKSDDNYMQVEALHCGEPVSYRARFVIGADGPSSHLVRALYPGYEKSIPWFFVGQQFHAIRQCPLDEEYFHFWFHHQLSHYTWSHARDGQQIVGVGFKVGDSFKARHQRVVSYLQEAHGVSLEPAARAQQEGCAENFGPSLINRYLFGKGRVLVTGQAAGFLNMIGEGMSCALHSGATAGEAVVEAHFGNSAVQPIYRSMIASEVRRTTDQWNPLQIAFGLPHEADFRAAMSRLSLREQKRVLGDMWRYLLLFKEFKWGRQIVARAGERALFGRYLQSQWL